MNPSRNNFNNGIWKVNPYLHFKDLESFCNIHTSALSKNNKVCTIDMFQHFSRPYCKNIHLNKTYENDKQMIDILYKVIKNPD